MATKQLQFVGTSPRRQDGPDKLLGEVRYVADMTMPGMLYGCVVRSPHAHARIKSIDTAAAKKVRGVAGVFTGRDVPGRNASGRAVPDQPILCLDKVRYYGDAVVLVAALSQKIAQQAAKLVVVEYEPLPVVLEPEEALKPGAPQIHEQGNLLTHVKIRKGDVTAGFSAAAHVVENVYRTPFVEHLYLEPEGALAAPHPDGGITLWCASQAPFVLRDTVARCLSLPVDKVHVIQPPTGGGFGGKTDAAFDVGARTSLMAFLLKRPVRMIYGRDESITVSSKRHAATMRYKSAVDAEGRLTAVEAEIYLNKGAYASVGAFMPVAGGLTAYMAIHASGPYQVPNVKIDVYNVYTNNPFGSPMRGYSLPQATFAFESQMDLLSEQAGLDPLEIRLRNALDVGSVTGTGQLLTDSVGLKETLVRAAEAAGWADRRRTLAKASGPHRKRGMGIACTWHGNSSGRFPDHGGAYIYLTAGGKLEVLTGICELGQGPQTVMAQITAEETGQPMANISVLNPETDTHPDSLTTTGTRSTVMAGNAVKRAAEQARQLLDQWATEMLGQPRGRVILEGGVYRAAGETSGGIALADVAHWAMKDGRRLVGSGFWQVPRPVFDRETGQGRTHHAFTFGTEIAEVEVDTETGEVTVPRMIAAFDVGKAINPQLVEAQIEGGVVMGVGYALMEEIVLKQGVTQNPNMTDYLVPTSVDVPRIQSIIVEHPSALGPYGAKGIGEPPVNPAAAAIANAVADATGVRLLQLPMDPERVRAGLVAAEEMG